MSISLDEGWRICQDLYRDAVTNHIARHPDFQDALLFCLLGGFGICYELNQSAATRVASLDPFDTAWDESELTQRLVSMLSLPLFEPRRTDGSLRRYRFPVRKASLILKSRRWLSEQAPILDRLTSLDSEHERRQVLCECPGIGMKTASWLLRNAGLGDNLAIIDIHISRALLASRRIDVCILPNDYLAAETAFLQWCDEIGAPPAAFDLFVWDWQRGALGSS